jgi:hypothetical protein
MIAHCSSKTFPLVMILAVAVGAGATTLGAGPGAEQYAKVVSAEPELVAWWPFEGDCNDVRGAADGRPTGGLPQFGDGPNGGKAMVLNNGRFVTMGNTPQLDLKQTTVELWFQLDFTPGVPYNPCIIAKRADGDHRLTRFSIHVWSDYSCLAIWNGSQVLKFQSPDGPLRRGQWYHLAVACTTEQLRLYLDGVPCPAAEPRGVFNFAQLGLPLSIGSSTPKGQELLDFCIDEVAIYRKALSQSDVARHVDAMGWKDRRLKLAAIAKQRIENENKLRIQREARRVEKLSRPERSRSTARPNEPSGRSSITISTPEFPTASSPSAPKPPAANPSSARYRPRRWVPSRPSTTSVFGANIPSRGTTSRIRRCRCT